MGAHRESIKYDVREMSSTTSPRSMKIIAVITILQANVSIYYFRMTYAARKSDHHCKEFYENMQYIIIFGNFNPSFLHIEFLIRIEN